MKKHKKLITFIYLFIACCTTVIREESGKYICVEHRTHHQENHEEFCKCLGINVPEYDSYQIFQLEDSTTKQEELPAVLDRLKDQMERKIVSIVMHKIEKAMGKHLYKYWKFEETNIPVTIRLFTKKEGNTYSALVVAAITKYHLSPRGIIMYLPLEYKMHILEKQKDE